MLAATEPRVEPPTRISRFAQRAAGAPPTRVDALAGDASTRRYHRAHFGPGANVRSLVVMELPPDGRPDREDDLPFLNVRSYLDEGGLPVPRVHLVDLGEGLLALDDLGDETLERYLSRSDANARRAIYLRAIELIAQLQELGRERPSDRCVAFGRRFDFKLLRWELDHFREWLLEVDRGIQLAPEERRTVDDAFDWLAQSLADAPQVLVHRDFQSRNLMVHGDPARLTVIDFQDALQGSAAYDLVALLRDSYVVLPGEEVDALVSAFVARMPIACRDNFSKLFHMQTAQRKLKDAGRFVFIDRVRGNPGFLKWIPASLRYARDALAAVPELADARAVLARHVPELR
jgi:N-acetylmuramate 1-kinase